MRGTFRYLKGENEAALQDLNKSLELDPGLVAKLRETRKHASRAKCVRIYTNA